MASPIPKPAAIKALEGNPGKRALPKGFVTASGTAERPKYLTKYATEIWDRATAAMPPGIYTGADVVILVAYCQAADALREATIQLHSQGYVVTKTTKEGSFDMANPWWKICSEAMAKIASLGARLGLDPVAREAINAPPEPPGPSKFQGLVGLNGGKA